MTVPPPLRNQNAFDYMIFLIQKSAMMDDQ
jgi:hypothetical protein